MKQEGLTNTSGGTILDPRDGKVYNAMMTLAPDGQTLVVRGYLGISLLGKNQYWTRLPDSAYSELDPRFNPNTAARRANAAKRPPRCRGTNRSGRDSAQRRSELARLAIARSVLRPSDA